MKYFFKKPSIYQINGDEYKLSEFSAVRIMTSGGTLIATIISPTYEIK